MYNATVELSGEKYVSGSKVILMTQILMRFYAKEAGQRPRVTFKQAFAQIMLNSFICHLNNVEFVNALALATLCDRRYKKAGSISY